MQTGGHPKALTYELDLPVVLDVIEGGVDSGRLPVENRKLAAVGLPRERNDAFCNGRRDKAQGESHGLEDAVSVATHTQAFCWG